ncbi:MAG TPA: MotA/TolQ/ExbB proton channel family protein [Pirellulales bacterium]|jgi:biopolymer transport protein ExbB/TolQ|nr:MotA/TolQ/ExbB proton channel family protein [Pirellulales bacterium]
MNEINKLAGFLGDASYLFLALNGLWGAYCVIVVWRRLKQLSFRSRRASDDFVEEVVERVSAGDLDGAMEICEADPRALPHFAGLAIANAELPPAKLRHMLAERFQEDVLLDLDHRISWIVTVIKSGPLLGLFGTVLGMMAAFGRIGTGEKVEPHHIAHEISIALICTAMGLMTAIPLNFLLSAVRVKLQKMQQSVSIGLARLVEVIIAGAAAPQEVH